MSGDCGTCTLCCTIMGIHDLVPPKPMNQTCTHCPKGATGCNIYPERPESCRTYECLWLQSQSSDSPFHRDMRPDKARAILNPGTTDNVIVVEVDPRFPNSWRRGTIADWLHAMLQLRQRQEQRGEPSMKIVISVNQQRGLLNGYSSKDGFKLRELVLIEPTEDGMGATYAFADQVTPETKDEAS